MSELEHRRGDLVTVARESGIAYDTVLRIKNRENDPGYSKVLALHAYLFGATAPNERRAQQEPA